MAILLRDQDGDRERDREQDKNCPDAPEQVVHEFAKKIGTERQ